MLITRFEREKVNKNLLKSIECDECRNLMNTEDIYTIGFATNKDNGKGLLLCGNCARELKNMLEMTIR